MSHPKLECKILIGVDLFIDTVHPTTSNNVHHSFRKPNSPAVKGQTENCSFFDKSIKLGKVANLHKTNIS